MDNIKQIIYGEFKIEIHPQPKTGDNTQTYFGVWKNDSKVFGLWVKISGTNSRTMRSSEIFSNLENTGIEAIKRMIDENSFTIGHEYRI